MIDVLDRVGLSDRLLGRPDALDVELQRDGTGLSSGEAQLLALARVFLRDPELVVLDEATARIDPETEARLEHAIADVLHDRTALVIAHRVSTLASMDRLAVLDDGRVVEQGTRAELLADPGVYARLEALATTGEMVT